MRKHLRGKKKPLLLHPLLRDKPSGSGIKGAGSEDMLKSGFRVDDLGRLGGKRRVQKNPKKVLAGTGKVITFATRFRKEDAKVPRPGRGMSSMTL